MASDDNDLEGAVGGINLDLADNIDNGLQNEIILNDLINIDELKLEDEENWLTSSLYKPATSDDAQNASVEEWINISATKFATESTFNMPHEAGDSSLCNANRTNISKKSLVSRLDTIAKGTPPSHNISGVGSTTGSSTCSSNLSPGVSSYLRQNLSSTPANKGITSRFDPRTFTRSHQKYSDASFGSPISGRTPSYSSNSSNHLLQLNISDISLVDCASPMVDLVENTVLTSIENIRDMSENRCSSSTMIRSTCKEEIYCRISPLRNTNATFEKEQLQLLVSQNTTFSLSGSTTTPLNEKPPSIDPKLTVSHDNPNSTFDIQIQKENDNETFTFNEKGMDSDTSQSSSLIVTDTKSTSVNTDLTNKKEHSPTIEHSTKNGKISTNHHKIKSECSETSLSDGLRRSMPNLNRIRGRGGGFGYRGGIARNSGIPGATANRGSSATSYGLSKIHNSDTRIGTQGSANSTRMLPPNAIPRVGRNTQYRPQGNITSRQSKAHEGKIESNKTLRYQANSRDSSSNANRRGIGETKLNSALPSSQQSNTIRQPSTSTDATALSRQGSSVQRNVAQNTQTISKIARPVGSGIPRPGGLGSRLPAPTAGRIPKLSTGSLPGSRASSLGPQRHPYSNEYC